MNLNVKRRIEEINSGIVPEGYKRTKVGIVPVEWEETKIGNCGDIITGNTPPTSDSDNYGFDHVWVTPSDINSNILINSSMKMLSKKGVEKSRFLKKGTVLVTCIASIGKNAILDCDGSCNQQINAIYLNSKFDNVFFYYLICHNEHILKKYAGKSATQIISKERFSNLILCFPPLPEQQKIAEILFTQDKLIELQEKKIEQLKKLKKAYLQKMFPKKGNHYPELRFQGFTDTWEQRKLGEVSSFITKGATPTTYGYEWQNEGIPFFRNDCIKDNSFVYGDFSYISDEANRALNRSEIKGDDILIAITGDIGKVGIVPSIIHKANINQHIARVRVVKDALPYFIYQSLITESQQNKYKQIKTGISMPQLSLEQIRETIVLVPSMDEQSRISGLFEIIDQHISLQQQKLAQENQKKKSLMQLLLTGKVRVIP